MSYSILLFIHRTFHTITNSKNGQIAKLSIVHFKVKQDNRNGSKKNENPCGGGFQKFSRFTFMLISDSVIFPHFLFPIIRNSPTHNFPLYLLSRTVQQRQ